MNLFDMKNIQCSVQNLSTLAFVCSCLYTLKAYIVTVRTSLDLFYKCDQSEIKLPFLFYHQVLHTFFFLGYVTKSGSLESPQSGILSQTAVLRLQ